MYLYPGNPSILSEFSPGGVWMLKKHLLYRQENIQGANLG